MTAHTFWTVTYWLLWFVGLSLVFYLTTYLITRKYPHQVK